jgi:hypothetical protein
MRVLHERCCDLDMHQRFVVACLLATSPDGAVHQEVRTDTTMTADVLALSDWRRAASGGRRLSGRTYVSDTARRPVAAAHAR